MSEIAKASHQGTNVKIARMVKDVKQNELAEKLNMHQSEISTLESQQVIAEDILQQISLALDIPMNFLKEFDAEEATKTYNNDSVVNSAENGKDTVNVLQGENEQQQTINYFPLTEVMEMTEKLLNMQKDHYEKEILLHNENAAQKVKIAILEERLKKK